MSVTTEQIKRHEGFEPLVYIDTVGKRTIGYGLNLDAGMSDELATHILKFQVQKIAEHCDMVYDWFNYLNAARQAVVINMIFNLGQSGFSKFVKLNAALEDLDFPLASIEMMDSKWARQVKGRAGELADQMLTGEFIDSTY